MTHDEQRERWFQLKHFIGGLAAARKKAHTWAVLGRDLNVRGAVAKIDQACGLLEQVEQAARDEVAALDAIHRTDGDGGTGDGGPESLQNA